MSELQTAITNLQLKHSELVAAVKTYPGTVASAANAAVGEASVGQRTVRDFTRNLRNQIEPDGQSLILDWEHNVAVVNGEGKPINEVVEFSRSTGGGRFGPDGKYEWVEAGVPRIDYDPETGECLGLLVEEQRTNLHTRSEENTFTPGGNFPPVVVSDTFHLGVKCAAITFEEGDHNHYTGSRAITRSWPLTAGRTAVWSCQVSFSRPLTSGESVTLYETGSGTLQGGVVSLSSNNPELVGSFRRVWGSGASALSGSSHLAVYGGNIESPVTVYIHSVQRENGSFPTSYIPTNGSAVSRGADIVTAELSPWFSRGVGTVLVAGSAPPPPPPTVGMTLLSLSSTTHDRLCFIAHTSSGIQVITRRGSNSPLVTADLATGTPVKAALSFIRNGDFLGCINGGQTGSVADRGVEDPTRLYIGSHVGPSFHGNTHISQVAFYPRALSDTELQELTTL